MLIELEKLEKKVLEHFWGGDGALVAAIYQDENNKILKGTLAPGSNIGLHCHETSSEIIFIVSGEGRVLCDGKIEGLKAGDCHYCKKGSTHSLRNDSASDLVFYAVVPNQ